MVKLSKNIQIESVGAAIFGLGALGAAIIVWWMVLRNSAHDRMAILITVALVAAVLSATVVGGLASGRVSKRLTPPSVFLSAAVGIQVTAISFCFGILIFSFATMVLSVVAEPSITMAGFGFSFIYAALFLGAVVAGPIIFPIGVVLGILMGAMHRVLQTNASIEKGESSNGASLGYYQQGEDRKGSVGASGIENHGTSTQAAPGTTYTHQGSKEVC